MKTNQEKANESHLEEARKEDAKKKEVIVKLIFEFPGLNFYQNSYQNQFTNWANRTPSRCGHAQCITGYNGYSGMPQQYYQPYPQNMNFPQYPQPPQNHPQMSFQQNLNEINPMEINQQNNKCGYDLPNFMPNYNPTEPRVSQGMNTDDAQKIQKTNNVDFLSNDLNRNQIDEMRNEGIDQNSKNDNENEDEDSEEPSKNHEDEKEPNPLDSYKKNRREFSKNKDNSNDEDEENNFSEEEDNSLDFDQRTAEIRLVHFDNLNKLLILVFSGVEITEKEWNLTQMEEKILNSVLKRKFYNKVQNDGIRLDESNKFAFINQLAKISTLKRPKDCYKMLLGRLFRILKKNYFEKNKFSNQNVYLFYQYYFGDLAKKENIQIQAFFYPFERNNKFISLFPKISHHLNFRYYERIFKSERFANDIKTILHKVYSDHFSELKFKFSTLLKKWEKLFYTFDNDEAMVEKTILKYLQFNNRCKIPFTASEIENSITLFEKMISKFEN